VVSTAPLPALKNSGLPGLCSPSRSFENTADFPVAVFSVDARRSNQGLNARSQAPFRTRESTQGRFGAERPKSLGRTRRPMRCRPRPVAIESALWFIAPPRRAMLRIRRSGRRSALSRATPCGIAVDAAPRSERSRHEDARARGCCSLRSESLRSLNLTFTSPCDRWRRTTGWLPSLSGAEVRGASLCATLVAEPSLEFASSLHPEVLAACLFRDRGPSLGFVT